MFFSLKSYFWICPYQMITLNFSKKNMFGQLWIKCRHRTKPLSSVHGLAFPKRDGLLSSRESHVFK